MFIIIVWSDVHLFERTQLQLFYTIIFYRFGHKPPVPLSPSFANSDEGYRVAPVQ